MQSINSKFTRFLFFFLAASLTVWTSCEKDDDEGPDNEEELITTVRLTFTDSAGNDNIFTFSDTDGAGGNPPVAQDITLAPNTSYALSVEFLDESDAANVEDITEEIKTESDAHLLCFDYTLPIASIDNLNLDGNGKPLGLTSSVSTGDAGTGTLTLSLKHQPDKDSATPCATGETDVEATFDVIVQ